MILQTTHQLVQYLLDPNRKKDYSIISCYTYSIIACGSLKDAQKLTTYYISHSPNYYYSYLVEVINILGDKTCAQKVFDFAFKNGCLKKDVNEEVLELVGKFQIEGSKEILIHYAFDEQDHYVSRSAIMGLLYFDCSDIEEKIIEEIENTYGKGLFKEYIPVLVCKLPNPKSFLEKLYELGENFASTDCNGGIVLAFALCGKIGYPYFKRLLFNPQWETSGGGTGTDWATYQGIKKLDIYFGDLYNEIKEMPFNSDEQQYSLHVLLSLLSHRITDQQSHSSESLLEIYEKLYGWDDPNHSNNITDLVRKDDYLRDKTYDLERKIESKIKEELILQNFQK